MIKGFSQLKSRLSISSFIVLFLLITIYFSHHELFKPFFVLQAAAIFGIALSEYYALGKAKGHEPLAPLGLIASTLIIFSTLSESNHYLPLILFFTLLAGFGFYCLQGKSPYVNLSLTLFGLLYVTAPLTCILMINYHFSVWSSQDGRMWVVYLLLVTKLTDTGAYFAGKKWGKKKMSPFISPNKTWEGAFGGITAGTIASFLAVYFAKEGSLAITPFQSVWLGMLLSASGQFGDLAESLLKRDTGVKDSSSIPGLGGVLDMVDSLIFTAPLLYLFLAYEAIA